MLKVAKQVSKKTVDGLPMFLFNYNHRNLNPMDKFTELLHTMLPTPSII